MMLILTMQNVLWLLFYWNENFGKKKVKGTFVLRYCCDKIS